MYHILTKFNQFHLGRKLFFLFVFMFLLGWNQSIAYSATTANPSFSLSSNTGGINSTFYINGRNFPSGSTGTFYFDSNDNGQKDDGEPSVVVTVNNYGNVTGTTLTTPNVAAGTYSVRYISNPGVVNVGPMPYKIVNPSFSLSPNTGSINCAFSIGGSNFPVGSTGTFYFDSNNNGQKDDGEPSIGVTADNYGNVAGTLRTLNVAAGTYYVRYISNSGVVNVAPNPFTIVNPSFSLSSNTGGINFTVHINGRNFPNESTGTFYFDSNNNGQKDDGEPSGRVTSDYGVATGVLTTPNVAAGTYYVRYISNSGVVSVESKPYIIVNPSFSLSSNTGGVNSTFNINGSNFPGGGTGTFYFDSNNNGQKDDGEPSVVVTADHYYGRVTGTLTTPNVAAGTYRVRYISNSGVVGVESKPYTILTPSFSLTGSSGGVNCTFNINGSKFPSGSTGTFYFDSNNNGQKDDGEPSVGVTADNYGGVTGTLATPNVAAGTYRVRYISRSVVVNVESKPYIIVNPSFSLSSNTGGVNSTFNINGSNFPGGSTETFYFDSNNNGQKDDGELSIGVTAENYYGTVTGTFTTPNIVAGTYYVRCVPTSESTTINPVPFTIASSEMSLSVNKGGKNTQLNVKGKFLPIGSVGIVYFDSNNNGQKDKEEPSVFVEVGSLGEFNCSLTTPNIAAGTYYVRYVPTSGSSTINPVPFTIAIPEMSLSVNKGGKNSQLDVKGKFLPIGSAGIVYFDSNNNGRKDNGEPSAFVAVGSLGEFNCSLTTPNVAAGSYYVRYVPTSGSTTINPVPFTIAIPEMSLSVNKGGKNTQLDIEGKFLPIGSAGVVYFDSNNNGRKDNGEPSVFVAVGSLGEFNCSLTTPNVAAGTYYVRYVSTSGSTTVNPVLFKIVNSNKTKVDNLVDYVKKNHPNADVSILNHKLTINIVNPSETLHDSYKTLINKGNFKDLLDEAQDIVLGNNNSLGADVIGLQDYLSLLSNGIHAQYIEKQADGSYKVKTDEVVKRIRDKYATFGQLIANVDKNYGQKQIPDLKIDGYTVTKIVKVYKDKDVTIYDSSSKNKADKTVGTLLKNILPVDSLQNVDTLNKLQYKNLEGIYKIYLKYNGKAINAPYIIQIKDKVKN